MPLGGYATTLCVNDATDLFNDLKDYSDGGMFSGGSLEIHLVRNKTYKVGAATGNKPFTYKSTAATGTLLIQGGWNAGCTQLDPSSTNATLDGNGLAQVLKLDNDVNGIFLLQLTIQNGESASPGGGLAVNTSVVHGGTVQIIQDVIRNNHTTGFGGGFVAYVYGTSSAVYGSLFNSLVVNNSADFTYAAGYFRADHMTNGIGVFLNTVYGNTTPGSTDVGGLAVGGTASAGETIWDIAGNIFSQNTNTGLYLFGTPVQVVYNDYGSIDGTPPSSSTGNVSVGPKFVDAASGDFHLSSQSPLFKLLPAGGFCQTVDLDGFRRVYASPCDAGAYEETIFYNGLELP